MNLVFQGDTNLDILDPLPSADSVHFSVTLNEGGYWIPVIGSPIELALAIHTGFWKRVPLAAIKFPLAGINGTQYLIYDFILANLITELPWRTA
jgi:hypothetical protein